MTRRYAKPAWTPARRRSSIAAIHVCRAQLGIDDDTYRELLARVSRKSGAECRSAADLTERQAAEVLAEMRRLGATRPTEPRPRGRSRPAHYPGTPHNDRSMTGEITKIEALLADMKLTWSYADAIAKRMYGIDRVAWCSKPAQLIGILSALHVEQEKRDLLTRVEALCAQAGITTDQLEADLASAGAQLRAGWRRNRAALKWLVEHLGGAEA